MKKGLLLFTLICGLAYQSKAQQPVTGTVLTIGSNLSLLQGQDIKSDPLPGFEAGLGVFKRYNRALELQAMVGYAQNRFDIHDVENDAGQKGNLTYPVNTFYNNYVLIWYVAPKLAIDAGAGWSLNFSRHNTYRLATSNGNDYYSFNTLSFADATPFSVIGVRFGWSKWQFVLRHEYVFAQKAISGNSVLSNTPLGNNNLQRLTLNIQLKIKS